MSSPPSSAAVLEYLCLFTHDLRRKQKRWQDGRLKFHTFNKRVMVYDERGNFVGDMHWRADYDFDEGEEFQLERGAVIVQVSECIGQQDQDLSELLDRRAKEKEQRQAAAASRPSSLAPPRPSPRVPPGDHFQLRHRPLHQLIGTPSGHHGRAVVPTESPYEERHGGSSPADGEGRTSKRRRHHSPPPPSKKGYAHSLFGQPLTLSATPLSSAPIRQPSAGDTSPELGGDGPPASRQIPSVVDERLISVGRPPGNSSRHAEIRNGPVEEKHGASNMLGPAINSRRRQTGLNPAPQPLNSTTLVPRPWNDEDAADNAIVEEVPEPSDQAFREDITRTGPQLARTRPTNVASDGKHGSSRGIHDVQVARTEAGCGDSHQRVTAHPQVMTSSLKRQDAALAQKYHGDNIRPRVPAETEESAPEAEPKVELRIKSRRRRGLLLMSERMTAAPAALQRAHDPETWASDPGAHYSRARTVTQDNSTHDDIFASSLISDESTRPTLSITSKYCEPSGSSALEDHSIPLRECSPNIPRRDTKSPGKRARRPLGAEKIPSNVGDLRPRASPDTAERLASAAIGLSFGRQVGDSSRTRPSSAESWSTGQSSRAFDGAASGDCEGGDSINTEREKGDPSEAKPEVSVPVTRRRSLRRKAHEVADWEPTSENDDDGANAEDRIPERLETTPPRGSKRARTDETPKVPAGPRLARLSRRGVKSREVIGLTIDPVSLLRNLGIQGLPFENQPPAQPSKPGSGTTREDLMEWDQDQARRDGCLENAARPTPPLQAEHAKKVDTGTGKQASLHRQQDQSIVSREVSLESTAELSNGTCDRGDVTTRTTIAPPPVRPAAIPPAAERPRSINGLSRRNSLMPSDAAKGPEKPGPELSVATACEPGAAVLPRIVNPATRGRKAALKSDAAGQVPQHVLPPNPVVAPACPPQSSTFDEASIRPSEGATTMAKPPVMKMRFPGFVTAKDSGPWSREAYDLLETGRPV